MTSLKDKTGNNTTPENSDEKHSQNRRIPRLSLKGKAPGDESAACSEKSGVSETARNNHTVSGKSSDRVERENSPSLRDSATISCSIFEIKSDSHQNPVNLPQILTVFASPADKASSIEKSAGDCVLPPIKEANRTGKQFQTFEKERSAKISTKNDRTDLFDYRVQDLQQRARKRQIKLLRKRGFGTGAEGRANDRFFAEPYEGSCDDFRVARRTPTSSPKSGKKKSLSTKDETSNSTDKETATTLSPPAGEETLAKIQTAYREWEQRTGRESEGSVRYRKRSASHSPTRSSAVVGETSALASSLPGSSNFLYDQGNLRKNHSKNPGFTKRPGNTYQAIASPAESRRRIFGRGTLSPAPAKDKLILPEPRSLGKLSPLPQNKRLNELRGGGSQLSSSLPDLNNLERGTPGMNVKCHRPRTSSLKKSRPPTAGKSPQVQRKSTPKLNEKRKKNAPGKGKESNNPNKEGVGSPAVPRRVVLNTSLPMASPTFQRAMKGMRLPDKEYSEIFDQNRRDSILRSYAIPENALNSFRDDYDLSLVESSTNALEEMTKRFKEDVKIYKDGWDPQVTASGEKPIKSILRKRRQSVDDLEISTRKNLTKYLESKRDEDEDTEG